ncbi:MAG TPA: AAA family ATPase [Prolixibacteraceae bacterium]|nr:AAA family ATPase [Prolixibacteraceae bacterium]
MRIKKIQLKNGYKRFHDLTIDLGVEPKRIIALVGPNGCGKSSVLDGMLFLNNAYGAIGNKGGKDHNYHSMNQTPNFNYTNIIIELAESNFQSLKEERSGTKKQCFHLEVHIVTIAT